MPDQRYGLVLVWLCNSWRGAALRSNYFRLLTPWFCHRTYAGGLSTCHHGWHLLDADQEVPWPDQKLTYYFKWRFYFQVSVVPNSKPQMVVATGNHFYGAVLKAI
eukprot:COSAG02_NODE_4603_length_5176_cov_2.346267_2_plen_105_part_00